MSEDLSAQRQADLLRLRAERARQEAQRLDEEAARWRAGAVGERRVERALATLAAASGRAVVLHDRLLNPAASRVNLDHVVATNAGVFLIDTKNWAGDLNLYDGNLWLHTNSAEGRRHVSKHSELDKVSRAASTMQRILGGPVIPVLALANPWHDGLPPRLVRGVHVLAASQLVDWLGEQRGDLTDEQLDSLRLRLEACFPPATRAAPLEQPQTRSGRPSRGQAVKGAAAQGARRNQRQRSTRRDLVKLLVLFVALLLLIPNLGRVATVVGTLFAHSLSSAVSPPTTTPTSHTPAVRAPTP